MKEYKAVAIFAVGVMIFLAGFNWLTSFGSKDASSAMWAPDASSRSQPSPPPPNLAPQPEPAARVAKWSLAGRQGDMRFVTIDAADVQDRPAITQVAAEICSGQPFCYVNFWSDPALTPRRLPLNDAQVAAQIATYRQNTSKNVRIWIWACAVYPDLPPDECFS